MVLVEKKELGQRYRAVLIIVELVQVIGALVTWVELPDDVDHILHLCNVQHLRAGGGKVHVQS